MQKMTKNEWIAVVVVIVFIGYLVFFTNAFSFFTPTVITSPTASPTDSTDATQSGADTSGGDVLPVTEATNPTNSNATDMNQLIIKDTVVGTGAVATAGKTVTVNYTGMLTNGKVFDTSASHGQPFSFVLGAGQVIAGWDQGVAGMKVGGKRHLSIPATMGYGPQAMTDGQGNVIIPANSTLEFDVELVGVK